MKSLSTSIQITVNENIYLKDPKSSELGLKIISGAIDLIDSDGFDNLTFRKLARLIKSTEASIYRYFESKHKLLIYLMSWYWGWMEYKLVFALANVPSREEQLSRCIRLITERVVEDRTFSHIDEVKLNRIVISESSKAFLTRDVDEENKIGAFISYKSFVARVSDVILCINTDFKYPHMLVTTVIEGAHQQRYFADHLPRLTDTIEGEDSVGEFYSKMVFKTIKG